MRLTQEGDIVGARIGRAWVFLEDDVVAFLREQAQKQTPRANRRPLSSQSHCNRPACARGNSTTSATAHFTQTRPYGTHTAPASGSIASARRVIDGTPRRFGGAFRYSKPFC
ncbi:helix-turn-helix domain-containing protein [Burkholderia multivorans]|nr:helix-turn-helix domain-containing protein [Burkholderia multivorans]